MRTRRFQDFTIDTIFEEQYDPLPSEVLWRSHAQDAETSAAKAAACAEDPNVIEISGNRLNIVRGLDTRDNVRRSIRIGLEIAATGKRVYYINTFASIDMLRDAIKHELAVSDIVKTADRVMLSANFRMAHIAMADWQAHRYVLEEAIIRGEHSEREAQNDNDRALCDVVILNSFEMAAIGRERMIVADNITDWMSRIPLTAIVFTHDQTKRLEAGLPVRGALGMLTVQATTLWKVDRSPIRSEWVRGCSVHELAIARNVENSYTDSEIESDLDISEEALQSDPIVNNPEAFRSSHNIAERYAPNGRLYIEMARDERMIWRRERKKQIRRWKDKMEGRLRWAAARAEKELA